MPTQTALLRPPGTSTFCSCLPLSLHRLRPEGVDRRGLKLAWSPKQRAVFRVRLSSGHPLGTQWGTQPWKICPCAGPCPAHTTRGPTRGQRTPVFQLSVLGRDKPASKTSHMSPGSSQCAQASVATWAPSPATEGPLPSPRPRDLSGWEAGSGRDTAGCGASLGDERVSEPGRGGGCPALGMY